jgi:hypothetical protein
VCQENWELDLETGEIAPILSSNNPGGWIQGGENGFHSHTTTRAEGAHQNPRMTKEKLSKNHQGRKENHSKNSKVEKKKTKK